MTERRVMQLGERHPFLTHLHSSFQTMVIMHSNLLFVQYMYFLMNIIRYNSVDQCQLAVKCQLMLQNMIVQCYCSLHAMVNVLA
jgi:hypothetical protein